MKKVIVTGASGFVGRAVVRELTMSNIEVVAIVRDNKANIDDWNQNEKVKIVYCNMENIEDLPGLINDDIDACIHLAWAGSYGNGRADYVMQLENVIYSTKLVDTLSKLNVKRFVGIGTLAEKDVLNYHATAGAKPNDVSIYGIAKITNHFITKVECTKHGIEHIWCYLSNTYGVGNTTGNFVNFAITKMLKGERASFTKGEQMYDFINIVDAAKGIVSATLQGKVNTAYFIGSTKQRALKEYILIIRDKIDPQIELYLGEVPYNGQPLPPQEYDCSKLVEDTDYRPTVDFEDGIVETIAWLKARMEKEGM